MYRGPHGSVLARGMYSYLHCAYKRICRSAVRLRRVDGEIWPEPRHGGIAAWSEQSFDTCRDVGPQCIVSEVAVYLLVEQVVTRHE